jgi:hypothetical protein
VIRVPDALMEALRTINRLHNLGDAIYDVRERADMTYAPIGATSWDHPDVKAYSDAVDVVYRYLKEPQSP